MEVIVIFVGGMISGLVLALISISIAARLQYESARGQKDLMQLIKEQNALDRSHGHTLLLLYAYIIEL